MAASLDSAVPDPDLDLLLHIPTIHTYDVHAYMVQMELLNVYIQYKEKA